ncbi:MAG: L,D-transpeptidase [Candidatus Eisenbacteria bacterium]|nr:L,D-transpeptidase [Candidatus Eisenbacteria bacterium]
MDARADAAPYLSPAARRLYERSQGRATPASPLPRALIFAGAFLGLSAISLVGTGYSYNRITQFEHPRIPTEVASDPSGLSKQLKELRAKHKQLESTLAAKTPKQAYLVIDQTQNRLYIRKGEESIHTAVCSAGSGYVLKVEDEKAAKKSGKDTYVFDTPRGVYKILRRVERPVWKKPDWAYYEEGKPLPRSDSDRFETGVLGKYALHLGDGYMIHGTLYKSMLGRSVSHGCIRLGTEDLQMVWESAPIGTPVYIY